MKVVVTGATGFIGSNLVEDLVSHKYEVAILKRKASDLRSLEGIKDRVHVFPCDSYDQINYCFSSFNPDIVIHLATEYLYSHSSQDIPSLISSNIAFGVLVLEAMEENGCSMFVNFTTRWKHINDKRYNPSNLYAATKQAFEDILIFYAKKKIRYKTLEIGDTFGPNDSRKKVIDLMIDACANHKRLDLTPGDQIVDIVYIKDLTNFIISKLPLEKFYDNSCITLVGNEMSIKELGEMIEAICQVKGYLNWGAKAYRDNEIKKPVRYYKKCLIGKTPMEIALANYINIKLK